MAITEGMHLSSQAIHSFVSRCTMVKSSLTRYKTLVARAPVTLAFSIYSSLLQCVAPSSLLSHGLPFHAHRSYGYETATVDMARNLYMIAFLLAILLSAAICGSLDKHEKDPPEIETKGISLELFDRLHLMAQYAVATYYPSNVNSTGDLISCSRDRCHDLPKDNCPLVEDAKASTCDEFMDTFNGDDHGRNR